MAYKLKLIAVGNSTGVILPKELLERLRLGQGDSFNALEEPDGVHLRPFDAEFDRQMEVAEKVMRQDKAILRKLAQ
jgi:putative addiction module antidote